MSEPPRAGSEFGLMKAIEFESSEESVGCTTDGRPLTPALSPSDGERAVFILGSLLHELKIGSIQLLFQLPAGRCEVHEGTLAL